MRVEQVTAALAEHGEGPVWWDRWNGVRWVDMFVGDVLELDNDHGDVTRTHVGAIAAVVRPRRAGIGAVVALERQIALTDGPLDGLEPVATIPLAEGTRFNEGGCAPDGSFYVGSVATDARPGGAAFYRITGDGQVTLEFDGVTVSNGFDFSPDHTTAYYVDTRLGRIDAFDYSADTGLTARRCWVPRIPADGVPDGLTVDAEGGVWVAMFGGGAIHRYDTNGRLDEVIKVPTTQVTACTFGGHDLDQLYITTSTRRAGPDQANRAGALFVADCGVRGQRTLTYGR